MNFISKRNYYHSQVCALSASILLAGGIAPALAQVPGIPVPGANVTNAPPPGGTVLSGQVKTDVAPAEKLLSQGKYAEAEALDKQMLEIAARTLGAEHPIALAA